MTKKRTEKGIALIEVIAALGVTVIVITSLVALSISTMRASLRSKLLLEGTKIANRELELVRAARDNSLTWTDFVTSLINNNCSSGCHMTPDGVVLSGSAVDGSGTEAISRSFTATEPGGAQLSGTDMLARISVSVTWNVGGTLSGAYLYTDLTSWRSQ